jgi:hypothetical protein
MTAPKSPQSHAEFVQAKDNPTTPNSMTPTATCEKNASQNTSKKF